MNAKKIVLLLLIVTFLPINKIICLAETNNALDLKLQTYISSIYSGGVTKQGREEPIIYTQQLRSKNSTTARYAQSKDPIGVKKGDFITYTFRVYNEGNEDSYVQKITTNIPKGLQFIYIAEDGETPIACDYEGNSETLQLDETAKELISKNNTYWALDSDGTNLLKREFNGENTISITCDVESYFGKKEVLKSYNESEDTEYNGRGLNSLSVTVVLRVIAENRTGEAIRIESAITGAQTADFQDRDSSTDVWQGKDGEKNYQDDEDYETVILGKISLTLNKTVIAVSNDISIENEEYLTQERTNTLTVLPRSYILYNIKIYNEGQENVYAKEIKDYLPEYLDYVYCDFNDKYGWNLIENGKTLVTNYLSYEEGQTANLLESMSNTQKDETANSRDIQILCRLNEKAVLNTEVVNDAKVTFYQDETGKEIPSNEIVIEKNNNKFEKIQVGTTETKTETNIPKEENSTNSQNKNTNTKSRVGMFILIGLIVITLFIIEFILIKKYILK